ncbi:MAG: flagellar biosynthetic protein FliR [Spirochaetales bacterium]|nr:flagellar biosynthetic protein FliR [Spirochaetales bacterium]
MFLESLANNSEIYFLIFARIIALFMTSPVLSNDSVPGVVRNSLALMITIVIFPFAKDYMIPDSGVGFVFVALGEVILGIITGFFISIIFSVFQLAGQMFAVQMGFGASQVYDPLAQVEIPVIGQLFNFIALFIFITTGAFQKIFIIGILRSIEFVKATDLIVEQELLLGSAITSISTLFSQSLIISFPILGTLILLSVTMGLLAKAAPQMNLMMIGFPIQIAVGFVMIAFSLPFLMEKFAIIIDNNFYFIAEIFSKVANYGK